MTCPRHLSPGKEILLLSASHWGLAGMHPGVGPPPDVFRGGWGAVPPCRAGKVLVYWLTRLASSSLAWGGVARGYWWALGRVHAVGMVQGPPHLAFVGKG